MSAGYHVAVVGATGAVGQEMLQVLQKRRFPVRELTLLASARSKGKTMRFGEESVEVRELRADSFKGVQIALFIFVVLALYILLRGAGRRLWRLLMTQLTR